MPTSIRRLFAPRPPRGICRNWRRGWVAEWFKAAVLKTAKRFRICVCFQRFVAIVTGAAAHWQHTGSTLMPASIGPVRDYPAALRSCCAGNYGRVAEWFKAPVLKTGRGASLSWVQIPPLPPMSSACGRPGCQPLRRLGRHRTGMQGVVKFVRLHPDLPGQRGRGQRQGPPLGPQPVRQRLHVRRPGACATCPSAAPGEAAGAGADPPAPLPAPLLPPEAAPFPSSARSRTAMALLGGDRLDITPSVVTTARPMAEASRVLLGYRCRTIARSSNHSSGIIVGPVVVAASGG